MELAHLGCLLRSFYSAVNKLITDITSITFGKNSGVYLGCFCLAINKPMIDKT